MRKTIFIILFFLLLGTAYCSDIAFERYLVVANCSPNISCKYKAQLLYTDLRVAGIPKERVDIVYGDYKGEKHLWVVCDGKLYDPSILTTHSGFPTEQYPDYKEIRRFKGSYDYNK